MERLFVVVMAAIFVTEAREMCDGNVGVQWLRDPKDCSMFYMCVGHRPSRYRCPTGTVVDLSSKRCVNKGSPQDKCTSKYNHNC